MTAAPPRTMRMRCISRLRHDSALPFLAWTRWRQDTTSSISRPPTSILSLCTTLVSLFASVLLVLFCWRETSRSCHSSDASPVKEHYINKHYRDYLNAVLNFMIKMFSSTQVSVSSFQLRTPHPKRPPTTPLIWPPVPICKGPPRP